MDRMLSVDPQLVRSNSYAESLLDHHLMDVLDPAILVVSLHVVCSRHESPSLLVRTPRLAKATPALNILKQYMAVFSSSAAEVEYVRVG